jgi:O-antigen/teichoic acid export membrane protein
VAALACYVPTAIGQALLAEGGRDGAHLRGQVRLAILVAGGLMVIGAALATVGRNVVVSLYGEDYRDAAELLPILVAAAIPWAVTSVYLTEARVLHKSGATVAITGALTVFILGPALVLVPRDGIDGAAAAFLGGNLLAAGVALGTHVRGRTPLSAMDVSAPDELTPEDVAGIAPLV